MFCNSVKMKRKHNDPFLTTIIVLLFSIGRNFSVQYRVSADQFPYQYWRPISQPSTTTPRYNALQPYYNKYYQKTVSDLTNIPKTREVYPIDIPNDLVGEVGKSSFDTRSYLNGYSKSTAYGSQTESTPTTQEGFVNTNRPLSFGRHGKGFTEYNTRENIRYNQLESTYTGSNYENKIWNNRTPNSIYRYPVTNAEQFDPLHFNRYKSKRVNNLKLTRRKYNENLVDLIRQKSDRKTPFNYQENAHVSPQSIFSDTYLNSYNSNSRYNNYQEHRPSSNYNNNNISYRQWLKNWYNRKPYPEYHYENRRTAINSYPQYEDKDKDQNHLLYYYHPTEEASELIDYTMQDKKDSILERVASISHAPPSLLIPGGLAALGLGLAFYYFNYIWYPTPVVTARLSKIIMKVLDHNYYSTSEGKELNKVLEVFRGLESQVGTMDNSCRDRLVCQLHQEFPRLWNVTQMIAPIIKSHLRSESLEKRGLDNYMKTAQLGANTDLGSCETQYSDCTISYVHFRPLLNSIFKGNTWKDTSFGESRIL